MRDPDPLPNQHCAQGRRLSARRWFFGLFTFLLLLILGWLGWEQYQLIQRQAAAPVVSVAEDGTVRINGRVIVMPPDGLPPKVLEEMEGGPPVEEAQWGQVKADTLKAFMAEPHWSRSWHYPRTGITVTIKREVTPGTVLYQTTLQAGRLYEEVHDYMLEFRGQHLWVGPPGPLSTPVQHQMQAIERPGERDGLGCCAWQMMAGETIVHMTFLPSDTGLWLLRDLLKDLLTTLRPAGFLVMWPMVSGGSAADKAAAVSTGDINRVW